MSPFGRSLKRVFIIVIYLLIIMGIAGLFYSASKTKPTCNDGIQNQSEEGADCGGPCEKDCEITPEIENIEILEKALIPGGQNEYDALVKISNPNPLFGIADFAYSFDFTDEAGNVVLSKTGSSFLLPAETKYIFTFNVSPEQVGLKGFDFNAKSFNWQKFTSYEEPEITVYQKEFDFVSGSGYAQLKAKIQNRSDYDFRTITARVVIRDQNGEPVAINETNSNNVKTNEEREILFNWNKTFSQDIDVQNIEIQPEVDVFSDENFLKVHGSIEQYKSYEPDSIGQ